MDTVCKTPRKPFWLVLSLFVFSFAFSSKTASAQPDGAKLFKQNCAVCHSLGTNTITGPGLEGVFSRVPSEDWFVKWVINAPALTKSGDPYAVKISSFAASEMTVFEGQLTPEDVKAIAAFVKAPPTDGPKTGGENPFAVKAEEKSNAPFYVLSGIIVFLILLIGALRTVKHSLKNTMNEKEGRATEEDNGFWAEARAWMGAHKRFVALCVIFLLSVGSKWAWDAMMGIGVYQGYKPEQPIHFSHKIHAGDNAINCQYCHSGVEKSKTAGIPSVNVCMNCHKGITEGSQGWMKDEIAKVHEAAGFDGSAYTKTPKPIEWVKVHNLPDFVFFSHQQHVKVGKQECATCHGDVANMHTVEQAQPLTMGWCVDCHRKTEVPGMKDNPYYEELHKKLAEKFKGKPITVANMGGIECGKCHY